jgi:hypothetical protein
MGLKMAGLTSKMVGLSGKTFSDSLSLKKIYSDSTWCLHKISRDRLLIKSYQSKNQKNHNPDMPLRTSITGFEEDI